MSEHNAVYDDTSKLSSVFKPEVANNRHRPLPGVETRRPKALLDPRPCGPIQTQSLLAHRGVAASHPDRPLRWTCTSAARLAEQLGAEGHPSQRPLAADEGEDVRAEVGDADPGQDQEARVVDDERQVSSRAVAATSR